jgi:hypothetical protein
MNERNPRPARTLSALNIVAIVAILLLLASTAYLLHISGALRQQLASREHLPTQKQSEPEANTPKGETDEEHQRRVKEHLELLSLRGRVAQLTRELKERTNPATANSASSSEPTQSETSDSIFFTASTTNHIPPGHVLIIGGWHNQQLRGYFAITPGVLPVTDASESDRLALNAVMLWAPESFWTQIGWADAKSDTHRSTVTGVLTVEQLNDLLQALKGTEGADVSNGSLSKAGDGERIGYGFSTTDDTESGTLMTLDAFPRIAPDQQSVDLEIRPAKPTPATEIHPSLFGPH